MSFYSYYILIIATFDTNIRNIFPQAVFAVTKYEHQV